MEGKVQFLRNLSRLRKKLRYAQFIQQLQWTVFGLSLPALLITAAVWIRPFPFWKSYLAGLWILLIFGMVIHLYRRRATFEQSVKIYDEAEGENTISTVNAELEGNHPLLPLVLRDALDAMNRHAEKVQGRRYWSFHTRLAIAALLLYGGSALILTQGHASFETAAELKKKSEITKESDKRLEQEAIKDSVKKKELAKELQEIKKEKDPVERQKAIMKKVKENNLKKQKADLSLRELERFKKIAEQSKADGVAKALKNFDQKALSKEVKALSDEQLEQLKKQLGSDPEKTLSDALKAAEGADKDSQALAKWSENLSKEAADLAADLDDKDLESMNLADTGDSQPPQEQSGNQSDPGSDQEPKDPSSGSGSNAPGNGNGAGNGSGKGSGGANGSGNGNGTGNGTGSGSGSGSGKGAGLGQGSRDLLTIPERMEGKTNTETDSGKLNRGMKGEQFSSDDPVKRGSVRSYEEVYQDYYSSYRKGEDRQTIPKDLESVVESYFSEIDPGE
ncbi:hypothetical protein FZC83_12545 [Rossellomorea marisflavi]|uniref:Uncharacterized protein n=1 Tax=Rossellomorea marisflavi TaxID=189381 RepID=A0A5D4RWJ7_9BACI|nr:hypothetical protein [Rossellomorea marisflavi]TYS54046.1 hypothetical protein FZC83_12545 [Rossellomorea marisflavi]